MSEEIQQQLPVQEQEQEQEKQVAVPEQSVEENINNEVENQPTAIEQEQSLETKDSTDVNMNIEEEGEKKEEGENNEDGEEKKEEEEPEREPLTEPTLHISGLPVTVKATELAPILESFGEVTKIVILPPKTIHQAFGFVSYSNKEGAERCIENLNNKQYEFDNQYTWKVNWAKQGPLKNKNVGPSGRPYTFTDKGHNGRRGGSFRGGNFRGGRGGFRGGRGGGYRGGRNGSSRGGYAPY